MSALFNTCVGFVLDWEGGYSDDAGDPGNWTGGAVGVGALVGTKFGISAAQYPALDIRDLTEAQATALYLRDYWTPISGDLLPAPVAMVVLDGAVNSGVVQSAQWLQLVLGVTTDGIVGPVTIAAAQSYARGAAELAWETLAQRVAANGCDPSFSVFGLGWSRRTTALAFQAARMLQGVTA